MARPKRQSVASAAVSVVEPDEAMKAAFIERQSGRGSRTSTSKATTITSISRVIPNSSSDPASDLLIDDTTSLIKKETPSKSRMTFAGVHIPSSKSRLAMYSEDTSSVGSNEHKIFKDEISDPDMNDDDTPATSMAPTPAEPSKNPRKRALSNAFASASPLNPSKRSKTKTETLLTDASLALRLQASEYDDGTGFIDDPELSASELSDGSDSSDLSDFVKTRKKPSTQRKKPAVKKAAPNKKPVLRRRADTSSEDEEDTGEASSARRAPKIAESEDELDSDDLKLIKEADKESVFDSDDLSDAPSDLEAPSAETSAPRRRNNATRVRRRRGMDMEERAKYERERLEAAHPELKTLWEDLAAVPRITPVQADQPVHINRQLKSFQREGLDWMIKQEKSSWKGGLLGDEMGMGKTIQAVSLIMSDYPASSPSLVVVPPVALNQWASEIKEYTSGKLKVLIHHNTDPNVKKLKMADLKKYDVIMISYSGLESMHRKEIKGWRREDHLVKENSKIHAIKFHRLILDEAHSIKSRTTGVAKACFALKADYKWCLSGTPVQNRIGEFFSLLRFLDVKPFACYFCKACDCKQLHWQQDSSHKCTSCQHSGFNHVSIFNQELLNPLTQNADPEVRKDAMRKLRLLTDRLMLRRLKRDHTSSMELPPKDIIIHNEFFGHIERDFSSSIMSNTTRQFDTYVSRGVMLNNYANIFGLIMQMRQVANHPDLILKKHAHGGQNVLVCCICDEVAEEPIRSRCKHEFCRKCVRDFVNSFEGEIGDDGEAQEPDCPRCHIRLAIDWEQPDIEQDEDNVQKNSIVNRIKMEDWTSSTKIEMLIYDLYKLRSKKQTHKSIVFSQFTSMLQLVEWRLRRAGFNTVMLDGSMSIAQRSRSIDYFMKNVDVEVFLVSLKAGGVALNLTEASRVFIIDPWWNPAAEWQSADRCHRIGQKRPCVITRLCIEDSVESRMVMLQEKKANMINGTINNDDVAMEKLTPEDMQFLFRGA